MKTVSRLAAAVAGLSCAFAQSAAMAHDKDHDGHGGRDGRETERER